MEPASPRPVKQALLAVAVAMAAAQGAWALEVEPDRDSYTYLDRLSFTVRTDAPAGEAAKFWIIDSSGRQSSPIPLAIRGPETVSVAPAPFSPAIYAEDTYTIRVEYAGESAEASFRLVDTGVAAVPPYLTYIIDLWAQGLAGDKALVDALSEARVMRAVEEPDIPDWYMQTAAWAVEGRIAMDDFAAGLRYLDQIGAIGR